MTSGGGAFGRVRPRTPGSTAAPTVADVEGKRALYSAAPALPALGSVAIACGGCHTISVLGPAQAVRALLPSLHLPLLRRNRSYLRCPACYRWEWCHLTVRF